MERVGHVAIAVFDEQALLVWGGYKTSTQGTSDQQYHSPVEVLLYDPDSGHWTIKQSKGNIPPANSGCCGVVLGNILYIYGGYFGDPDLEGNSNHIYQLNLCTWEWTRLEPMGCKPLHRDKLFGWAYNNKLFFFGGFGTPPADSDRNANNYEYIPDRSHQWFMGRGWNNQLVAYNIDGNIWEWPEMKGRTPSPRAALAGFRFGSRVYIFGGRLRDTRLNDLYMLDMNSMSWSENLNSDKFCPSGRSWHSFTYIGSNRAILYGGLSSEGQVMGDSWIYDFENNSWTEMPLKIPDQRLWHQSVRIDSDWIVVGGVRTNIHTNPEEAIYADNIMSISITPQTLLRCCVNSIAGYCCLDDVTLLPKHLQDLIKARRQHSICRNILNKSS